MTGTGLETRPELERLLGLIRLSAVDVVLVTKPDRLAGWMRGAAAFFEPDEARGVRVVVTPRDIDSGSPVGRVTRTILTGVAEFEREPIRDQHAPSWPLSE